MSYGRRRRGYGIGRGGVLALLVGAAIIGAAFWLGPIRPLPAELHLLALGADGEYAATVQPPVLRTDAAATAADAVARAPLVLAVRNTGARGARPTRMRIAVPARFRLTGPAGDALPSRATPGSPLVQYEFDVAMPALPPGGGPLPLPAYDTLWLEAVLPQYHCAMLGDGVPEFVPAPPYDAATLADVRLFYGFEGPGAERQGGLLTVQLDPALLTRESVVTPRRDRVTVHMPAAPRPELGPLTQVGIRTAQCGDPEAPIALNTVLWEGQTGGWMYEVHVDGRARKLVYDLNRDGRADLEIWDAEGDGGFRARRETNYVVPSFLRPLPQRTALLTQPAAVDTAWLRAFYAVQNGPYRFGSPPSRIAAAQARALAEAQARAEAEREAAARAAPPPEAPPIAAEPVDSAWLARFLDAEAGPFRFAASPPPVVRRADEPPVAGTEEPATPPAADEPAPTPAQPAQPRAPRLLGEPVPWPPRDTVP